MLGYTGGVYGYPHFKASLKVYLIVKNECFMIILLIHNHSGLIVLMSLLRPGLVFLGEKGT